MSFFKTCTDKIVSVQCPARAECFIRCTNCEIDGLSVETIPCRGSVFRRSSSDFIFHSDGQLVLR